MRHSKKAWEAWTQNTDYACVKAFGTCFKPNTLRVDCGA